MVNSGFIWLNVVLCGSPLFYSSRTVPSISSQVVLKQRLRFLGLKRAEIEGLKLNSAKILYPAEITRQTNSK